MRQLLLASAALLVLVGAEGSRAQRAPYRTLNDTFTVPPYASADQWQRRAAYLREHILASAGLLPMPERTPLRPVIFGEIKHPDYTVSKAYFESLPGFLVTGNLYRPIGNGPFPAILSPHGHWTYGRLENTPVVSAPARAINLARQGFVVFTYDLIGYDDSTQLPHRTFGGPRENLWGLSVGGLQVWNGIRALDFLEGLPYVRRDAIGVTGESGGGTQTLLISAVDNRVAAAVPVNMVSFHMQGGCVCENPPGLRLDTNNVEIAATIAPRPLLMVSATGDWTADTMEREYPAVRALYSLLGAPDHVHAIRFEAEHNYNRDSREAMYAWMARWLQHAPADVRRAEQPFTPDALPDLLVFNQRPLPEGAVTATQLTSNWIAAAKHQLSTTPQEVLGRALRHALGFGDLPADGRSDPAAARTRTVLVGGMDAESERQMRTAGFSVKPIAFTPFDADAASKIAHFETYNRTAASQRVADIVAEMRANPGAALVASGDAALAALLAAAIVPIRTAILDVGAFDGSSDSEFLEHLYVPGLRRAGDLATAARMVRGRVIVHDATGQFNVEGLQVQRAKLALRDIIAFLLYLDEAMNAEVRNDLRRVIGFWGGTALIVGITIGSGIFRKPPTIAALVPNPLVIMGLWTAFGLISICGALTLAELSSLLPRPGGVYVYLREAYGDALAFVFGWLYVLVTTPANIAALSTVFAEFCLNLLGGSRGAAAAQGIAITAIVALTVVNVLGAQVGSAVGGALTLIKLAALAAIILGAFLLGHGSMSHLMAGGSVHGEGVARAMASVIWTYDGWIAVSMIAGEVVAPEKLMKRIVIVGMLVIVVAYIGANLAYFYMMPVDVMAEQKEAIARTVMTSIAGPAGGTLILLAIMMSVLGALNGNCLAKPRVAYAMARDGLTFSFLGKTHPRWSTPWVALLVQGAAAVAMVLALKDFDTLTTYFVVVEWTALIVAVAAVFVLRRKMPDVPRPFYTPGYPWVPLFFVAGTLVGLTAIVWGEIEAGNYSPVYGLAIAAAGFPVFRLWKGTTRRRLQYEL